MNHYYNKNYSLEEITEILNTIQDCVREEGIILYGNV